MTAVPIFQIAPLPGCVVAPLVVRPRAGAVLAPMRYAPIVEAVISALP